MVEQAKLLLTLDQEERVAAVGATTRTSEVEVLQKQLTALTEQVGALGSGTAAMRTAASRICYHCHQPGHIQRTSPAAGMCFICRRTVKDAYPLPRPDEVQDQLVRSTVFSTLGLQNGYWQLPVSPADQAKTAFSLGPGMGLFQFRHMPFGLAGAPSSFQRLLDKVCRGYPLSLSTLMMVSSIPPLPNSMKNTYIWCFRG